MATPRLSVNTTIEVIAEAKNCVTMNTLERYVKPSNRMVSVFPEVALQDTKGNASIGCKDIASEAINVNSDMGTLKMKRRRKQAEAELCQAQIQLLL